MSIRMFSTSVAVPGTPQRLTANPTPAEAQISGVLSGQTSLRGSSVVVQAAPGNTASKYIYLGSSAMSVAAKTGIGIALAPGASVPLLQGDRDSALDDVWIDTDGLATDKLFVTVAG